MSAGSDRLHAALQALQASLSDLESFLLVSRDLGDEERAAGYRMILGIHKWVADWHFLAADTQRPRFIKFMDEFSQWGLGNPDNGYWIARVDGETEYVVSGTRGTSADICIELRSGIGRKESGEHSRTLAYLDADSLVVDADGRYQVIVGGTGDGPNRLPAHPDAEVLFLRQTFNDWDREEMGQFWIERAGPPLPPASVPNSADVAAQIEAVARRLNFVVRINDAQVDEFRKPLQVNFFPPPKLGLAEVKSKSGFFPGQHNALAWWQLPPNQAVIISLVPPDCRYLGFMIGHPRWFAALDFENRQCSLNLAQAAVSSDGRVHYVIARADPCVPNWIDPGYLDEGFMFFRCQGLRGQFDTPEVRVVPEREIRLALPADAPAVTSAERNATVQRRRTAIHRRFL